MHQNLMHQSLIIIYNVLVPKNKAILVKEYFEKNSSKLCSKIRFKKIRFKQSIDLNSMLYELDKHHNTDLWQIKNLHEHYTKILWKTLK